MVVNTAVNTFWDVFDKRCCSSGHAADKGSRSSSETFIRQAEEVRHTVTNAAHQAGRTAQDLQRPHHPSWDKEETPFIHQLYITKLWSQSHCYNCKHQIWISCISGTKFGQRERVIGFLFKCIIYHCIIHYKTI